MKMEREVKSCEKAKSKKKEMDEDVQILQKMIKIINNQILKSNITWLHH